MYLPIHYSVPDYDFDKIINITIQAYKEMTRYLSEPHLPKPDHPRTIDMLERAKL